MALHRGHATRRAAAFDVNELEEAQLMKSENLDVWKSVVKDCSGLNFRRLVPVQRRKVGTDPVDHWLYNYVMRIPGPSR